MKKIEKRAIEEDIFKITLKVMKKWEEKLSKKKLYFDNPIYKNNGSETHYYSEIEFNIFHEDGNLICPISIIMFMENKQVIAISKVENHINEEIEASYQFFYEENSNYV